LTRALKRLAKHSVTAMVGSVVCLFLADVVLIGTLRTIGLDTVLRHVNFDAWYLPIVWWPGLVLGFFVNRRTLHRTACFVWFPGLLWLGYGIVGAATSWRPDGMSWMTRVKIDLFSVKPGECGMTECLGLLVYTWPAVNSVAYSIGAALGLLSRPDRSNSGEPFTEHTTLGLS
jgi:hypothetical protein